MTAARKMRFVEEMAIEHSSQATAVGSIANVHLAVYRGPLTVPELTAVHQQHLALRARHERTCVLSLAEAGVPLPDADVRALATRMGKEIAPRTICSSQVVAGEGFWVSAARSMLTAMLWIQIGAYPSKVFADPWGAAEWVVTHNPGGPDSEALATAITRLRAA